MCSITASSSVVVRRRTTTNDVVRRGAVCERAFKRRRAFIPAAARQYKFCSQPGSSRGCLSARYQERRSRGPTGLTSEVVHGLLLRRCHLWHTWLHEEASATTAGHSPPLTFTTPSAKNSMVTPIFDGRKRIRVFRAYRRWTLFVRGSRISSLSFSLLKVTINYNVDGTRIWHVIVFHFNLLKINDVLIIIIVIIISSPENVIPDSR